jgi:hypothetical protein
MGSSLADDHHDVRDVRDRLYLMCYHQLMVLLRLDQ